MTLKNVFVYSLCAAALSACGGGKIDKETVGAYFSTLAGGQVTQGLQGVVDLFCDNANDFKVTNKEGEQTVTLNGCTKNGIKTTGEVTQKVGKEEVTMNGKVDFEVIDPAQNGFAACRELLKKGDKASCSVDSKTTLKDGQVKTESNICGMSSEEFNKALPNACQKQK